MDDRRVSELVERVVARLREQGVGGVALQAPKVKSHEPVLNWRSRRRMVDESLQHSSAAPAPAATASSPAAYSTSAGTSAPSKTRLQPAGGGIYDDVDRAVQAARCAFEEYSKLGFAIRYRVVEAIRKTALENLEAWSRAAVEETGLGRVEDKVKKNRLVATKTFGPELLRQPDTYGGDDGHTITERAPFGVIASIIPCTNSTETIINNGISMLSAGNTVVFNPHPIAKRISASAVRTLNLAIAAAGGPRELLSCLAEPSIDSAHALMRHPLINLVMVTGGGAVVEAAQKSGKRAICAGPGNPPAVVDETADLDQAARDLVAGASFDNNVVCTDEKVFVVVESVADALKERMLRGGCVEVKGADVERLTELVLAEKGGPTTGKHGAPNRKFVGKNASLILRELGIHAGDDVRLALVDVERDHPLAWTEQLMPVMPLVRMKDADEAIAYAAEVEANRRHTASIHSRRVDRITAFARALNCSLCIANAPNYAGLGAGGEGYTSFSIATPTGEGLTTARTFTRERRLAVCGGGLRFV